MSERKIIDYVILVDEVRKTIEFQVCDLLAQGFELYGFPFECDKTLHQCVVKYEI